MDSTKNSYPPEFLETIRERRLPTDPTMLINWINALIYGNITSMDELRSGVIFCQMLNSLYPGCIEMESLHHEPKSMWDKNYKKFKRALDDLQLEPHLSVSRLMRGSVLDNIYIVHFFIDLYHVHIGLSMERRRRREEKERQKQKNKPKEDPPKKQQESSAIYELFQWFKNLVMGPNAPLPPPKVVVRPPRPKPSEEEKQRDFDRQVRLLFFEPVPLSEFEEEMKRQKGGGNKNQDRQDKELEEAERRPDKKQDRQDKELEEAERRQRQKDHDQLRRLVAACLQLRDGHQLMQELYMESRKERLEKHFL
ncbi:microtubule-associated protein RP/EB family member 2-like isoform X2 [Drosophila bipectinata]|uniref:microtubule-associated protein RP/EB family member 2-like isoform X2 n=1 Tax=Drosophila bipectinata TaxID=42026 RepID=UPI001C896005|nr:trichohyalin-like isoform X2 [Drosophila bipectinata]